MAGAHRGLFERDDAAALEDAVQNRFGEVRVVQHAAPIKSLSEDLVDGFISPIFWYVLAGLPGVVLFKAANTMDSMVGYKTERYLYFGWCVAHGWTTS